MTKDDKAAVAKYKSALRAHEVMHFDVTDKVIKALPKTVKATGTDEQDAVSNLQTEVNTYQRTRRRRSTRRRRTTTPRPATARRSRGGRRGRPSRVSLTARLPLDRRVDWLWEGASRLSARPAPGTTTLP